jgi:hypothetical protein
MKPLKIYFSIVFSTFLLLWACNKEDTKSFQSEDVLVTRNSTPSVVNGMLSFSTYQDFLDFVDDIKLQEKDSTTVRNAYTLLGIDISAEQTTNITDYPVCRITENGISGFTSARRIEENAINTSLNSGGDAFSIIDDAYLKTALNSNSSVHIGTRIFKFYDNGGVVIVLNNNWTTYDSIKTLSYFSVLSTDKIFVSNQDESDWSSIYNYNLDGTIAGEKANNFGNTFTYSSPLACYVDSNKIQITAVDNGMIRIELLNVKTGTCTWTFSNSSQTLIGNPVTLPCPGDGRVFLEYITESGGRCLASKYFSCKCGEKKRVQKELVRTVNGETWRIQASIWVKSKEVGCEMNYKRKRLGIWLPASNKGVCTDLSGTYKREMTNKSCVDVPGNGIKCLGNGTYPTSISVRIPDVDKIFRESNKLSSGHRVNVKGTWFGFGVNGVPRLILD